MEGSEGSAPRTRGIHRHASHRDGHGRARGRPADPHPVPRSLRRPPRARRAWPAGGPAADAARPAQQPARLGNVADQPAEPADCASHRQPFLADAIRAGNRFHRRGLRLAGRGTDAPRTAGLASGRLRRQRLGRQGPDPHRRQQCHLSAVVEGGAGTLGAGSRQPAAGAGTAPAAAGRVDPRSSAGNSRSPVGRSGRAVGEAIPAQRALEGAFQLGRILQ